MGEANNNSGVAQNRVAWRRRLKRFEKHLPLMKKLLSRTDSNSGFNDLSTAEINFICECIHNTIYADIGLTKKQEKSLKKKLTPAREDFFFLSNKKNPIKKKRVLMQQNGAGIGMILATVAPLIVSLIASAASK